MITTNISPRPCRNRAGLKPAPASIMPVECKCTARGGGELAASCEAVPAGVGLKAFAKAPCQALEIVPDVQRTARARVVHRPAAKRRKACGEHHGAVERVLIRHDAFA